MKESQVKSDMTSIRQERVNMHKRGRLKPG